MPTNLIVRTQGSIWKSIKPHPEQNGLLLVAKASGDKANWMACAYTKGGDRAGIIDKRGKILILNFRSNRYTYHNGSKFGAASKGASLAFNPVRRSELLVSTNHHNIAIFDVDTNTRVASLKGHRQHIRSIDFTQNGLKALSCSKESVQVWDMTSFKNMKSLSSKTSQLDTAAFTYSGKEILTCLANSIYVWDASDCSFKYHLKLPQNTDNVDIQLTTLGLSENEKYLMAGGDTPYLALWAYSSKKLLSIIALPEGTYGTQKIIMSPNGKRAIVLSAEGKIFGIHIESARIEFELATALSYMTDFDISFDTNRLLITTEENKVLLYDLAQVVDYQQKLYDVIKNNHLRQKRPKGYHQVGKKLNTVKFGDDPYRATTTTDVPNPTTNNKRYEEAPLAVQFQAPHKPVESEKWTDVNLIASAKPSKLELEDFRMQPGMNPSDIAFNFSKLKEMLLKYGEYPKKYRPLIWRFLLSLPENKVHYGNLIKLGNHQCVYELQKLYPISDETLFRRLGKVMSCLAHYAPVFATSNITAEVLFPFLKVFGPDHLSAFETMLTFFHNWGQSWFEFTPNPSVEIVEMLKTLLERADPTLADHLDENDISPVVWGWKPLTVLFTEQLTASQWLKLCDHLFTMPPIFLYYFVVAYVIYFRKSIFHLRRNSDYHYFFEKHHALDLNVILKRAYDLLKNTELDFPAYNELTPLLKGQYPLFARYPRYTVNYEIKTRERILAEERDLLLKKQNMDDLRKQNAQLQADNNGYKTRQQAQMKAADTTKATIDDLERDHQKEVERIEQQLLRAKIEQQQKPYRRPQQPRPNNNDEVVPSTTESVPLSQPPSGPSSIHSHTSDVSFKKVKKLKHKKKDAETLRLRAKIKALKAALAKERASSLKKKRTKKMPTIKNESIQNTPKTTEQATSPTLKQTPQPSISVSVSTKSSTVKKPKIKHQIDLDAYSDITDDDSIDIPQSSSTPLVEREAQLENAYEESEEDGEELYGEEEEEDNDDVADEPSIVAATVVTLASSSEDSGTKKTPSTTKSSKTPPTVTTETKTITTTTTEELIDRDVYIQQKFEEFMKTRETLLNESTRDITQLIDHDTESDLSWMADLSDDISIASNYSIDMDELNQLAQSPRDSEFDVLMEAEALKRPNITIMPQRTSPDQDDSFSDSSSIDNLSVSNAPSAAISPLPESETPLSSSDYPTFSSFRPSFVDSSSNDATSLPFIPSSVASTGSSDIDYSSPGIALTSSDDESTDLPSSQFLPTRRPMDASTASTTIS